MTITSVELDVLWSIRSVERQGDQWDLYINYRPRVEQQLAAALYGASEPAIQLSDTPLQRRDAEIIVAEGMALIPPAPEPTIGTLRIPLAVRAVSFNHNIRWADGPPRFDPAVLNWHRDLLMGSEQYRDSTDGAIAIAELSTAAQAAIQRLDGYVIDVAYSRFERRVAAAAVLPEGFVLVPAKTPVFISYRRTHLALAKALHALLTRYGNGRLFDPYLDEHQLEIGSLRGQLRERIQASKLFMPLVSSDYALEGTVSREEYDLARSVAEAHDEPSRFFAPIYVGSPTTDVAKELSDLYRASVASEADFEAPNRDLDQFIRACARI